MNNLKNASPSVIKYMENIEYPDDAEVEYLSKQITKHPEYLDSDHVTNFYTQHAKHVIKSNESIEITQIIIQALKNNKPLSVIRLGDGELNILTVYEYRKTHTLDIWSASRQMSYSEQRITLDKINTLELKKDMFNSIVTADVIGVLGIYRLNAPTAGQLSTYLTNHIRGVSGQFRGIDYMFSLAKKGLFKDKIIAPAHLYFSVVKHIDTIIQAANKINLVTSQSDLLPKFKSKYPDKSFNLICLPLTTADNITRSPTFLTTVMKNLDCNLKGQLNLLGVGVWSEILAPIIKARGGVAIDMGSGFNLLNGEILRPLHRKMDPNIINSYFL